MSPTLIRAFQIAALLVVFFALLALIGYPHRGLFLNGDTDFAMFYTGAKLLGTGNLYEPGPFFRAQVAIAGGAPESRQFSRLPYLAVMFLPFTWLPYKVGYVVWQCISLLLLALATAIWTREVGLSAVGLTCLSFPVMIGFLWARDETVVLLAIALAVRLLQREQPVYAGMIAVLCVTMWHLFLPVALLVGCRRLWRFALGWTAGFSVLMVVSFGAEGLDWPARYVRLLRMPLMVPDVPQPNLHWALERWPWAEWTASGVVVLLLWAVCRKGTLQQALAGTLIAGLLLSFHAYPSYCQILLPAAFLLLAGPASGATRLLALASTTPPLYLFRATVPQLVPVVASALLVSLAFDTRRVGEGPPEGSAQGGSARQ